MVVNKPSPLCGLPNCSAAASSAQLRTNLGGRASKLFTAGEPGKSNASANNARPVKRSNNIILPLPVTTLNAFKPGMKLTPHA